MALLSTLKKLLSSDSRKPAATTVAPSTLRGAPSTTTAASAPAAAPSPALSLTLPDISVFSGTPSTHGYDTVPASRPITLGPPELYPGGASPDRLQPVSAEWLQFSARLFGLQRLKDSAPHPLESALLQRLQTRTGSQWSELLPRLPAVLPQLMGLMRRENLSSRALVDVLSRDPSLVGELMRVANSALYRPEREITDLASAVLVLGHEGLNEVVMRVTMRPIYNQTQGRYSRQAGTLLWDLGERVGLAAMQLAPPGDERFAAYLAGLSSQVGLMGLLRVLDTLPVGQRPGLDREGLHRQLVTLSAGWSSLIVAHWGFPTRVVDALVARPGQPGQSAEVAVLAQVVRAAGAVGLRHLMQPGLQASQLGDWSLAQRRAYEALEQRFSPDAA